MARFSKFNPGSTNRPCNCGCDCGGISDTFMPAGATAWGPDPFISPWVGTTQDNGILFITAGDHDPIITADESVPLDIPFDPPNPGTNAAGGWVRRRICCGGERGLRITVTLKVSAVETSKTMSVGLALTDSGPFLRLKYTATGYSYAIDSSGDVSILGTPQPDQDVVVSIALRWVEGANGFDVTFSSSDSTSTHTTFVSGAKSDEQWVYLGGTPSDDANVGDPVAAFADYSAQCECCATERPYEFTQMDDVVVTDGVYAFGSTATGRLRMDAEEEVAYITEFEIVSNDDPTDWYLSLGPFNVNSVPNTYRNGVAPIGGYQPGDKIQIVYTPQMSAFPGCFVVSITRAGEPVYEIIYARSRSDALTEVPIRFDGKNVSIRFIGRRLVSCCEFSFSSSTSFRDYFDGAVTQFLLEGTGFNPIPVNNGTLNFDVQSFVGQIGSVACVLRHPDTTEGTDTLNVFEHQFRAIVRFVFNSSFEQGSVFVGLGQMTQLFGASFADFVQISQTLVGATTGDNIRVEFVKQQGTNFMERTLFINDGAVGTATIGYGVRDGLCGIPIQIAGSGQGVFVTNASAEVLRS